MNAKKTRKIDDTSLDILHVEISSAKSEKRDFSISHQTKKILCETHGIESVVEYALDQIRSSNTLVIDETDWNQDITSLISRVEKESHKLDKIKVAWMYNIGKESVIFQPTEAILLSCSTNSGMLSTYLSGPIRYRQQVSNSPTPEMNWNTDLVLRKAMTNNLSNPKNAKEAFSRNRLRVGCMQIYGCHYPTSFPISVMIWILRREASMRPSGKLFRVIDPCAGWGDRLAGAMIAGTNVVENYVGIDPWEISNTLCDNIRKKLMSNSNVNVIIMTKRAENELDDWPESDLVFTSPPYGMLEQYNIKDGNSDDGQAWRLCESGNFITSFIEPMLRNAAKCTRSLNGRVIINIGNTKPKQGGSRLTEDLKEAAIRAGLVLTETFGMRLSVRAPDSSFSHGSPQVRAEPFFVFQHINQNK